MKKWTIENILSDLKKISSELGHFPTPKELHSLKRGNLVTAITVSKKGWKFYREELGFTPYAKHKWTVEEIVAELKTISEEIKHFPTAKELQFLKKGYLSSAINISKKGYAFYREQLGYTKPKRLKLIKKWNSEKIIEELKKLNVFPTINELRLIKRHDLISAIRDSRKGYKFYQKQLGFEPFGWNTEKITAELKGITDGLGYCPTLPELQSIKGNLASAIIRSKKGLSFFQEQLGFIPRRKNIGYWNKNLEQEFNQVIQKLGRFPTQEDLVKLNKTGIYRTINKSGKTLNYYRRKLGYDLIEKDKGYWKNWNNLTKELEPLIKNNIFPNTSSIKRKLGGGAIRSISCFGGIRSVAKKMGYTPSYFHITTDGHYVHSSYEYLFDEYLYSRNILHEADQLINPNHNYRYDFKIEDIYFEIWGYPKNQDRGIKYNKKRKIKEMLYKKLKLKLVSIEPDIFEKSVNEIENYFDKLMSNLKININNKKPDHLAVVSNFINIWNEEKVTTELNKVIEKLGYFPTQKKLKSINVSLKNAVTRYGGANYFANKLGYECRKFKYWNDDIIKNQLESFISKENYFPIDKNLREHGLNKLACAIHEHGGFGKFKKIICS